MSAPLPRERWACPRCNKRLYTGQASDVALHACGECGGIWVDNDDSRKVLSKLSAAAFDLANRASGAASTTVDKGADVACPVCRRALTRRRVADAYLDIDYCNAHGSWFDRGELVRVAKAAGATHKPPPIYVEQPYIPEHKTDAEIANELAIEFVLDVLNVMAEDHE